MKIKATTINRYVNERFGVGDSVSGRIEIQWEPDGYWLNLGIHPYTHLEWQLIISLLALGARAASDSTTEYARVEFIHEDLTSEPRTKPS